MGISSCEYTSDSTTNLYHFNKNIQGDVTEIFHKNGTLVGKYLYDAYGNVNIVDDTSGGFVTTNPFRYRGYYYDTDLQLYHLQTRHYDPKTGRFISPDTVDYLDPDHPNGLNLYAYCNNDPVNYYDPSGHSAQDVETALKIVGGILIIAGCIVGSVLTAGTLSVVLAGAAVGAVAGGVSAGVSTAISGGDIHDFGNAFIMSTVSGAISGAVCASPMGMWGQAGINAALSSLTYVGTQHMNGENVTFGGLISSALFGFAIGAFGGNGWMQNSAVQTFIGNAGKGFVKNMIANVGLSSLIRIGAPAIGFGGIASGLYGKYISNRFNPNGYFWGW